MQNLGVLLIEIFELYGKHFGYDETGITLRDGGTYFSKVDRGWQNERQKYLLSIEDPQDPSESSFSSGSRFSFVRDASLTFYLSRCSSFSQPTTSRGLPTELSESDRRSQEPTRS